MAEKDTSLLEEYIRKRDFTITAEPEAILRSKDSGDYVIHLHDARKLHYDVRLQWKGVLKCWAVPKGPSLYTKDKRLAIQTEDHPDEYKSYEGVIPDDQYGAGPSLIWDAGSYLPLDDFDKGFKKGQLRFLLDGAKLKGIWNLIRIKGNKKKENWLLIKERDEFSDPADWDIGKWPESVATGRTMRELSLFFKKL